MTIEEQQTFFATYLREHYDEMSKEDIIEYFQHALLTIALEQKKETVSKINKRLRKKN